MRILFAAINLPYPPSLGQRMRNWALLRALHDEGHRVALISFATADEMNIDLAPLRATCESVRLIPHTSRFAHGGGGYMGRMRALAARRSYGAWRSASDKMNSAISQLLDSQSCDVIICDEIYQFENLPDSATPVLLNKDGVVTEIIDRFLAYQTNPLSRAYGRLERELTLRLERRASTTSSAVLACSDRDADSLTRICPGARVAVTPNVIDADSYRPAEQDDGRTVMFVGAMDWMPNRDAIEFFVRESWSRLLELAPHARLVVAGRNPSPEFARRFARHAEITFTGTVPDVRPFLAESAVSIVPLRIGSGTRIKILEAAAMAKPVVSTAIGAEGLRFTNGSEIIIEDAPFEFARAIANLLHDEPRRRKMGAAARRVVVDQYGMPALVRALRSALGALPRTRGSASRIDDLQAVAATQP